MCMLWEEEVGVASIAGGHWPVPKASGAGTGCCVLPVFFCVLLRGVANLSLGFGGGPHV